MACQWSEPRFGLPEEQLDEPTVNELINAYRKWAEKHYRHKDGSPTGTVDNMTPLMRRLRKWYAKKLVSEFRPLAFKDVIRRLIDDGLSISTVNDSIARIKHMFRWGVSEEVVSVDTRQAIDAVSSEHQGRSDAKPRKIVEAVPDEVVEQTMEKLPQTIQAMVRLQLHRASWCRSDWSIKSRLAVRSLVQHSIDDCKSIVNS